MKIDVNAILYVCGAIASVAAAAGIISRIMKKAVTRATEASIHSAMKAYKEDIEKQISELNSKMAAYIETQEKADERLRKNLLSSTRDRINQAHDYYTRKRFIGTHSLFVIEELYKSYKELGGNSFIDRQMEDIRELEVRSAETTLSKQ